MTRLISPLSRAAFGLAAALAFLLCGPAGACAQVGDGAQAADIPLAQVVQLDAGATCLEMDRLTLRITRWRERDTVDARIRVDVHGDAASANRVSFTVTKLGGASAQRTLANAPEDCDELHSAVALAIALSIDATLIDPRAQKEAELPVPDAAEPEHTPLLPPPALLQHPERSRPAAEAPMHLELGLLIGPSVRVLRDTTPAFSPRLWFSPLPWFSLSLTGYVTHLAEQRVGTTPGDVSSTLATGGLEACFGGQPIEQLDLTGCIGGRLGALHNRGTGFTPNFTTTNAWSAISGAVQLRAWVVREVAVGVSIEGFVPPAEYVILVRGVRGAADQSAAFPHFGLLIAIGPVFRFF